MAGSAASLHFHARPHIFTMLFLAISLWMLDHDRAAPSRWIWILPLLTVVWVNLHGGFLLFVVLLALLALGSVVEGKRDFARRYALLFALCSAASIVDPYGIRLPLHVIEVVRSRWMMSFVDEFKAPDFRSESHLALMVLLFLSLAVLIPLLRKNRITDVLWILFLAYCSLTAVRYVALFAIVCLPIIAAEWSAFLSEFRLGRQALDAFSPAGGRTPLNAHPAAGHLGFLLLLVLSLGPVFAVDIPAIVDYPNHLARMYVLSRAGTAAASSFYQVTWGFYPNLAMDLIVPPLGALHQRRCDYQGFLLGQSASGD